jgi:hypothetical protein
LWIAHTRSVLFPSSQKNNHLFFPHHSRSAQETGMLLRQSEAAIEMELRSWP